MNMKNFINEFETYCETVEDTRGLEIIKQYYFDYLLNLETFVDDYIEIDISEASNEDIIKEADRLSKLLKYLIKNASYLNNIDVRDVHLLIPEDDRRHVKTMFGSVLSICYSELYNKKYPNECSLLYEHELEESDLPKWYIDLCNLADKYGM